MASGSAVGLQLQERGQAAEVVRRQVDLAGVERGAHGRTLAKLEMPIDGEAIGLQGLCVDFSDERSFREAGRPDRDLGSAGGGDPLAALDWLLLSPGEQALITSASTAAPRASVRGIRIGFSF